MVEETHVIKKNMSDEKAATNDITLSPNGSI